jgi:hypothetical protein
MRRHQLRVLLILGAVLSGLSAAHAVSYTFTTIDVPGAQQTMAFVINDHGANRGHVGRCRWPRLSARSRHVHDD